MARQGVVENYTLSLFSSLLQNTKTPYITANNQTIANEKVYPLQYQPLVKMRKLYAFIISVGFYTSCQINMNISKEKQILPFYFKKYAMNEMCSHHYLTTAFSKQYSYIMLCFQHGLVQLPCATARYGCKLLQSLVSFYYYNLYDPANECTHALYVCWVFTKVKLKSQVILELHFRTY